MNASKLGNEGQNQVIITDAATITAPGNNLKELWQRLFSGETAIRPVNRFPVDNYHPKIAACIEDLKPAGGHSMMHPLLDRLFLDMGPIPPDSFLITATTKAGIDNLELLRQGNPADFQDILLSSITDIISRKFGLINNGINISASCASSTIAVALGASMIASGKTEAVLICCADLLTEFTFSSHILVFPAKLTELALNTKINK